MKDTYILFKFGFIILASLLIYIHIAFILCTCRYRDTFLSKGAAVDGMTLFKTMTGKEEPTLESLTKRHTIKDVAQLKRKVFNPSKGPKALPEFK